MALLELAVREILACPKCRGNLNTAGADAVLCKGCKSQYDIRDGILYLFAPEDQTQQEERRLRDTVMGERKTLDAAEVLDDVAHHHCLPVMARRARDFRARFKPTSWIVDIGTGSGWYWVQTHGARLIAIDFSLETLNVARKVLSAQPDIVLVWADAQRLPIRDSAVSGIWSVQALQHLPANTLRRVIAEFDRVLGRKWFLELYNLNPAPLHRAIYRLFGRRFPRRGRVGAMEINLFSCAELLELWKSFRSGAGNARCGFSELFFHPDLRFRPAIYPTFIERQICTHWPALASLFARQIHIQVDGTNHT